MADTSTLKFNDEHAPKENSIEAFGLIAQKIKDEILKSRKHWDAHEPKMWSRAQGLSDEQLVDFDIAKDLVSVRSASTAYGQIILGKIRLPAVQDGGFVHIRIHDPPNRGSEDVVFHSLWTDEGHPKADGQPTTWNAIQTESAALEFFHE